MREAELLNALAQAEPGIHVDIRPNGVCMVATYYEPRVKGIGKTLMNAALDCAHWLLDVVKDHPEYKDLIPDVLIALANYDKHSDRLSL
jgi:hypothetical protein